MTHTFLFFFFKCCSLFSDHGSGKEGRRNFTAHDDFTDEEGHKIVRIKFNVQGTRGKGIVFAAVSSGISGDFQYLIFQHTPSRGKPISYSLVDNRRQLTTEDKQMRLAGTYSSKCYGSIKYLCQSYILYIYFFHELLFYFFFYKHVFLNDCFVRYH